MSEISPDTKTAPEFTTQDAQDLVKNGTPESAVADYLKNSKLTIEEYDSVAPSYQETTAIHAEKERNSIDVATGLVDKYGFVVDLGCGCGRDTQYWKDKGFAYLGLDASKGLLELARSANPQTDFIQGDLLLTKFQPSSATIIWASSSLQHIPKELLLVVLKNSLEALEPGGIFYANYRPPAEDKPKEGFIASHEYKGSDGKHKEISRFIAHYSGKEMADLLTQAGFEVIEGKAYQEDYDQYDDGGEKAAYLPEKNIIFARKPEA